MKPAKEIKSLATPYQQAGSLELREELIDELGLFSHEDYGEITIEHRMELLRVYREVVVTKERVILQVDVPVNLLARGEGISRARFDRLKRILSALEDG